MKTSTDSLLDHSVISFSLWDMLLSAGIVRLEGIFFLHKFQYGTKFIIAIDNANGEACTLVEMEHLLQAASVGFGGPIRDPSNCSKLDISRNGSEEWHFVHVHCINTQFHI